MTITKKLTKRGNSYALVIEKTEKKQPSEFVKKVNKKYGRTLKRLAE